MKLIFLMFMVVTSFGTLEVEVLERVGGTAVEGGCRLGVAAAGCQWASDDIA